MLFYLNDSITCEEYHDLLSALVVVGEHAGGPFERSARVGFASPLVLHAVDKSRNSRIVLARRRGVDFYNVCFVVV